MVFSFDFLYSTFEAIKAKVLRKMRDVVQDGFPGFQQNVFVYTVKIFKDYKVSTFLQVDHLILGDLHHCLKVP